LANAVKVSFPAKNLRKTLPLREAVFHQALGKFFSEEIFRGKNLFQGTVTKENLFLHRRLFSRPDFFFHPCGSDESLIRGKPSPHRSTFPTPSTAALFPLRIRIPQTEPLEIPITLLPSPSLKTPLSGKKIPPIPELRRTKEEGTLSFPQRQSQTLKDNLSFLSPKKPFFPD